MAIVMLIKLFLKMTGVHTPANIYLFQEDHLSGTQGVKPQWLRLLLKKPCSTRNEMAKPVSGIYLAPAVILASFNLYR